MNPKEIKEHAEAQTMWLQAIAVELAVIMLMGTMFTIAYYG